MKVLSIIIIMSISSVTIAQTFYETFPIATDSVINETEPYLTHYWYDGEVSWYPIINSTTSEEINEPLWLTFIETDSNSFYNVVVYNFKFGEKRNISISNKQTISIPNGNVKSSPIIENFLGCPIAIWKEKTASQTNLLFSVKQDSLWNTPTTFINNITDESEISFFTFDDSNLENQLNEINYLLRNSNHSIITNSINNEFNWSADDTLFSTDNLIKEVEGRFGQYGSTWIAFIENNPFDTLSYIKILQQKPGAENFSGTYTFRTTKYLPTNLQLNITVDYSNNYNGKNTIQLTWFEDTLIYKTILSVENNSLEHTPIESEINPDILLTSNTYLSFGGCIVDPKTYFLKYNKTDSTFDFSSPYGYYIDSWKTQKEVLNLSISGLNNLSFIATWEENNGKQSDILIRFYYMIIGNVEKNNSPTEFYLGQNYPNPFNPSTTINYTVPISNSSFNTSQNVTLKVYDILGREVATLVDKEQSPGNYKVTFNANELTSGIYFYQLQSRGFSETKKLIFLK